MAEQGKRPLYSLSGFSWEGVFAGVLGYWLWRWPNHLPERGYAVTILGLAAVIMAVRADRFTRTEGIIWIMLAVALCFVELRAIRHDREVAAKEQSNAREREETNFREIASGIKASIAESDRNFSATMGRTNQVLANITGGHSFAYVSPQNFYGDEFPGVVWNNGEQALPGLTLTIAHTSDPDCGAAFFQPIFIGTVGPHEHAPIPGFLFRPRADKTTGQDNYWIMLSAQNGTASQSIYFRRDRNNAPTWAFSFRVEKQTLLEKPQKQKMMLKGNSLPKGARVTTYGLLLYRGWSDELSGDKK